MNSRRVVAPLGVAVLAIVLSGCGSNGLARVSGKVTTKGQPVAAGTLVFAPVTGKADAGVAPATVEVKSDGTFVSSQVPTGKVRVLYNAPPGQYPPGHTPRPGEAPVPSPYERMVVKQPEIEVQNGATISLEVGYPGRH
jgi:hypothetical protein